MDNAILDYKILFESSPDVLLVLLPDAPRYTMVAATKARFLITNTTEESLGRGLFEVFPDNPDDHDATGTSNLRASLERVVKTKAPDTMAVQKYDIRGPDGNFEAKYWSPRNIPVLSPSGEILYILHRVEEVTELVRASEMGEELRGRTRAMENEVIKRSQELAAANNELRDANARLAELDSAKTAFFSNISHEFRTPLTLMLGPMESVLTDSMESLSPRQRNLVQLAYDNALRLLKLVNALLDFSRLEAGRLQANFVQADISAATAEMVGMFESAAHKAGVKLSIDCGKMSELAWIDRDMWEKIVPNLVSNALKFTLAGEIKVTAGEDQTHFVIEVSDTGIGIPEAELPKIFERFHRVAGREGRTQEGTGIGLALVRGLVNLHGGDITVRSSPGQGSVFRVVIPKGNAHLPPDMVSHTSSDHEGGNSLKGHVTEAARWSAVSPEVEKGGSDDENKQYRVLVVDDNADLRNYISGLLTPHYHVTTAPDGLAALEAIRQNRPDIVLSDVMMPRLDGFGLVKAIRSDPTLASLPIILLSARAGTESTVQGLDSGCDDYLIKPFAVPELLARVRTHLDLAATRLAWTRELERANRELDAFSYSVSHDLRAPLRAIHGFSEALAEDYNAVLDAPARNYLDRIANGVKRMHTLIEALLELSRITRSSFRKSSVNLSALCQSIVADLRAAYPERDVAAHIQEGLIADGDARLLNVVLTNLIGNAWKFTSKTERAVIEFGHFPGEDPGYFVRDNGAGFDMASAHKLFAPFQRLHEASRFEGTGIGLATVQRVIYRHGGTIWAEAEVEKGAAFFFTLPRRIADSLS